MKSTSIGATALMIAAQNGQTETVAKLLARGADVNAAASDGVTALMVAAQNGHTETVSTLLLRKDINVNAKIPAYRLTALFLAAQNGHAEIVAKLLARGADVDSRSFNGTTALMIAAQNGHTNSATKTVAELLDRRADVNAVKPDGSTALIFAAHNGHAEIVAKLLAQGADFNARASDGSTALMLAAENGHAEIVAELLAERTDLMHATQNDHDVVELLHKRADVNAVKKPDGYSALMFAVQNGRTRIAALLLDRGADVDSRAFNGATALMVAAQNGRTRIAALLLDRGADVNAAASDGGTALMVAAQNGHTKTVAELLDRGADVNAAASDGVTALIIAAQNGHTETVLAFLSRDGVDWQAVQDQLRHPALQNLNKEVSFFLAVALPEGEPRNSIITRFNQRNPNNQINQENNDILGAGLEMYKTLKDLKSWHKSYLTDPDLGLGRPENEAENSANERFFKLLTNQNYREEELEEDKFVAGLVIESAGLAISCGSGDENALGPVRRLSQEDFYKLTKKIIDSVKDESDIQKSQAFDLVAALRKDRTDHPKTEIRSAQITTLQKGQVGLCTVS
jgi:serine/threonine-protein phosphatase 6 regulatory ankyrin repeat subunit B